MPRYYFDVQQREIVVEDDEGIELPTPKHAELEATETFADINEFFVEAADLTGDPLTVKVRAEGDGELLQVTARGVRRT